MDSKDKELKQALDNIFGDNSSDDVLLNNIEEESIQTSFDSSNHEQDSLLGDLKLFDSKDDNEEVLEEEKTKEDESFEDTNVKEEQSQNTILPSKEDLSITNESDDNKTLEQVSEEEKSTFNIKKIIVYFFIGIIIGFILIFCLINYKNDKELKTSCFFSAEDDDYKITDEYKITYKNNKITYVEGTYVYTAKTEEYKKQVEFIKEEKLPIIINSNGMSGFTYTYESSSDFFKVYSYLDFEEFNMDKINKINQDTTPISFFKIKTDKKYEKLKESLEKKGFKCTLSN